MSINHAQWEFRKVESCRREHAQWPEDQGTGQFPGGGMWALTAFVLLQYELFWVWHEHTTEPEEWLQFFP